jgi:flagellar basal body-associated protein FliL
MTFEEIQKKALKIFVMLIIAVVVLSAGYLAIVLNWSYSKGDRIGYVQKFSEKGWLCKTWEGELQMLPIAGALPEKFLFSVRDKALIAKINASLGKKTALSYEQHIGIPTTCFGETEYFAVDARVLE